MFPIHALLLDVLDYNLRLNPHCVAPEIETYQLRSDTKELLLIDILITGAICGCCTAALLQGGKHDKSTFQLCMIWIMGIISLHLAVTIFVVTINRHWNEGTYYFSFRRFHLRCFWYLPHCSRDCFCDIFAEKGSNILVIIMDALSALHLGILDLASCQRHANRHLAPLWAPSLRTRQSRLTSQPKGLSGLIGTSVSAIPTSLATWVRASSEKASSVPFRTAL